MDETYRMLGREHEADLEREALKWRRAAEVRKRKPAHAVPARVAAFVSRAARVQALRPATSDEIGEEHA